MFSYKEKVKVFEPAVKYLDDLKKMFIIFATELNKKHDLTLEQIKDDPFKFYAWNYECSTFKNSLKVFVSE